MSQENVELVRRGFAAFEQGDLGGMLDLLVDDLVTYRSDPDHATYSR
jgi:ketosteroid isomerase-like protein